VLLPASSGNTKWFMNERMVGENIRAIRLKSEVSLTEVAKRAQLTKSTLSKIENGQTSSPISTLVAIAGALGVRLATFFQENNEAPRFVFTPKGKGKTIVRDGTRFGYTYEALAVDFPNKPLEPFLLTIAPGDTEGEFRHGGQEFVYMLSGIMEFTVAENKFVLREGDSLYFDPNLKHALKLLSKKPARFLCLFIEAS
jgi:transcriptional regulator with XRE-family HTH domain